MPFVELLSLERCRLEGGTFVTHSNRELAVFRFREPDRVFVIDNACPHAGGNLSGGEVRDEIVTCPWHQWQFDLRSGCCTHSSLARVRCYPAEIRDGVVWVDLPDLQTGN